MINNGEQGQELLHLLSLSVNRIEVSRQELEEKLGIDESSATDAAVEIPPFGRKKCQRSSLRNWIDSKVTKIHGNHRMRCIGGSAAIESHEKLFGKYISKAQADGKVAAAQTFPWCNDIRGNPSPSRSVDSLPVYCNGVLVEGHVAPTASNDTSVMTCASYLYCQLWWFRSIQRRAVSTAVGFSAFSTSHDQHPSISLLVLEKPRSGSIGGKFDLYEYCTNSFQELGSFLIKIPQNVQNPWHKAIMEDEYSPGCMLLPDDLLSATNDESRSKIVPTQTGSLVIRCENLNTAMGLVNETATYKSAEHDDDQHTFGSKEAWYIKAKTPASFGIYWDTAKVAIDATRRMLHNQWNQWNADQTNAAEQWLAQYPFNSFFHDHCNMLVMRDCGVSFRDQLPWIEFAKEMLGLVQRTLLFQQITNLVHGDIHEGNVLFNSNAKVGNRLVLIDWDEALPKQPCFRKTDTEEEKRRYPSALVSFPKAYSQHQFLVVFEQWIETHYGDMKKPWRDKLVIFETNEESSQVALVRCRFKALLRFLSNACASN